MPGSDRWNLTAMSAFIDESCMRCHYRIINGETCQAYLMMDVARTCHRTHWSEELLYVAPEGNIACSLREGQCRVNLRRLNLCHK